MFILAANIIPISVRYMKNKICLVSKRSIYLVLRLVEFQFDKTSHNLCELTTFAK